MAEERKVPVGPGCTTSSAANVSLPRDGTCDYCGAGLGAPHPAECRSSFCWHCGDLANSCDWITRHYRDPFPYTGDLEIVFAHQNRYYFGLDIDEFDFWPTYSDGKLVALRANHVGPGAWHVIETSAQARDLIDLTFPFPHLSMETADDCVEAVLKSPLLPRLQVLQIGDTAREWDADLPDESGSTEGENIAAHVRVIELMPRAKELYLAVGLPEPNRVLAAMFPPLLETLLLRSFRPFDLGVLALNRSLGSLLTLMLQIERFKLPLSGGIHQQFTALVNSPGFDRLENVRIDIPELDDSCCHALVTSRMVTHLRRLWLRGDGLTDAGAAVLAASANIRGLKDLCLQGHGLTVAGVETLRAAGVNLSSAMDGIDPKALALDEHQSRDDHPGDTRDDLDSTS